MLKLDSVRNTPPEIFTVSETYDLLTESPAIVQLGDNFLLKYPGVGHNLREIRFRSWKPQLKDNIATDYSEVYMRASLIPCVVSAGNNMTIRNSNGLFWSKTSQSKTLQMPILQKTKNVYFGKTNYATSRHLTEAFQNMISANIYDSGQILFYNPYSSGDIYASDELVLNLNDYEILMDEITQKIIIKSPVIKLASTTSGDILYLVLTLEIETVEWSFFSVSSGEQIIDLVTSGKYSGGFYSEDYIYILEVIRDLVDEKPIALCSNFIDNLTGIIYIGYTEPGVTFKSANINPSSNGIIVFCRQNGAKINDYVKLSKMYSRLIIEIDYIYDIV